MKAGARPAIPHGLNIRTAIITMNGIATLYALALTKPMTSGRASHAKTGADIS